MNDQREQQHDRQPGFWQVLGSVLAALLGVQSERNRARDFTHGRPLHYILVGLGMTVVLVLVLWGVVRLVLHAAGVS